MSDRFVKAATDFWNRLERKQWVYGTLGRKNSDGSYSIEVVGRVNFVYVTLRHATGAQTVVLARNDAGIQHAPKLSVKMKLEYGIYVIYGRTGNAEAGVTNPPIPPDGVPTHTHVHATLTFKDADDHTQYHTDARGDARYYTKAEHIDVSVGAADAGKPIVLNADGEVDPSMQLLFADEIADAVTDDTIVDADLWGYVTAGVLVKTAWSNVKVVLKAYFDTLYESAGAVATHAALTIAHGATGAVVGTTNAQTLTNKTLDSSNISTLTAKNPPLDADSVVIVDSAASNVFKRVTYTNVKEFLKTYFDTLYVGVGTAVLVTGNQQVAGIKTFTSTIFSHGGAGHFFTDDDVAHGMTDLLATNVYAALAINSGTAGGLQLLGATDADSLAFRLMGFIGTTTPTLPPVRFEAWKKNGTTIQALAASEIAFDFFNASAFIYRMYGNGDVYQTGKLTIGTAFPLITLESPSQGIILGTELGEILWSADDTSAGVLRTEGAKIRYVATGTWNGTDTPAYIGIGIRNNVSTFQDDAMALKNNGFVGIGTTSPLSKLQVEGDIALQPGAASDTAKVGGVLYVDSTQRANGTTVETDLSSYTVPADTLAVNNQYLELHAWGTFVNNANTKTLRLYFGADTWTLLSTGGAGAIWSVKVKIVRTGATTQKVVIEVLNNIGNVGVQVSTAGRTLSSSNILKLTGQSNVASNDVLQQGMVVNWGDANT